jgi:rhamnulose-1-phosphate aldolase/alcohol dehydrogenase
VLEAPEHLAAPLDPLPTSRWDETRAAALSEPEELLYRSNLLGSDKRTTNFGGGNTSAKIDMLDPLTAEPTTVLWVKGSGGDLGSMKLDGFATLYMDKLQALKGRYRGKAYEDEMVDYLPHCTFNLNSRAASIDTPLHAYIPYAHVDHMHPDAVIAIAASKRSLRITEEIFGGEIAWLPWQRPGYDLGLKLGELALQRPYVKGVILEGHGLFTWGESSKICYETTLNVIRTATAWLNRRNTAPAFGGAACAVLPEGERRRIIAALAPVLRGKISAGERKIGHYEAGSEVLEFVCSRAMKTLAAIGTSCPDHFLRTKIKPLVLEFDPASPDVNGLIAQLDPALQAYRDSYTAYYERCKRATSPPMRDSNPAVYLIPGVGMLTFAKDKATARIAGEFYVNAINVMRGASSVVDASWRNVLGFAPAYMLDQSHNVTDPIESLMTSAVELTRAYAQALLVDRMALAGYQEGNDALMAAQTLKRAFTTDVYPILARARKRTGAAIDPVAAYRASGYRAGCATRRPAAAGSRSGIV